MNECLKKELRKEFKGKLTQFSLQEKYNADLLILENLRSFVKNFSEQWKLQYGQLPIIGFYIPTIREPDIRPILKWNMGRISFPYCKSAEERQMEFCFFDEGKMNIQSGYFVKPEIPVFCVPDLVLVPGLAFDHKGHRLGQGHGYYDKYFERFNCMRIGLCYSWQKVNSMDVQSHDKKMKMLITEKETLKLEESEFL